MNRLPKEKQAQILHMLVEGNSLRATSRMADVSINTVTKLLVDAGTACAEFQDKTIRDLKTERLQCDEIWSFCYSKQKNVPEEMQGVFGYGDVWTWTALDPDSKLMVSWMLGNRDAETAYDFLSDVAGRVAGRVQVSSDGLNAYQWGMMALTEKGVDYGRVVKIFGPGGASGRYSPGECCAMKKERMLGAPDMKTVSTSHVERQNLTMRMSMRRFTRLTNGFSKKIENHMHAISLHFMHYNFCRIHKTIKVTPAMEAGIASRVWELSDVVDLIPEPVAKKRGPYKKRKNSN